MGEWTQTASVTYATEVARSGAISAEEPALCYDSSV
jgi:hypothetical protein